MESASFGVWVPSHVVISVMWLSKLEQPMNDSPPGMECNSERDDHGVNFRVMMICSSQSKGGGHNNDFIGESN